MRKSFLHELKAYGTDWGEWRDEGKEEVGRADNYVRNTAEEENLLISLFFPLNRTFDTL